MELCSTIFERRNSMNEENKKLLEEVIETRLSEALNEDAESDEAKLAFKEAMTAIDRQNEISKMEIAHKEQVEKRKAEDEFKKKESKWNLILRTAEVVVVPVGLCLINIVSRNRFATRICNFEKDYTFTTTPGKSLGSIFKWK